MTAVKYHEGKFPPRSLDWERLIPLIGPASAALARYDGILLAIPNAAVLLSPLMTQEAVLSSRIEGTQATMGEVLEFEAEGPDAKTISPEKRDDIEEVLRDNGILTQLRVGKGRREGVLAFPALLNIAEGQKVL